MHNCRPAFRIFKPDFRTVSTFKKRRTPSHLYFCYKTESKRGNSAAHRILYTTVLCDTSPAHRRHNCSPGSFTINIPGPSVPSRRTVRRPYCRLCPLAGNASFYFCTRRSQIIWKPNKLFPIICPISCGSCAAGHPPFWQMGAALCPEENSYSCTPCRNMVP